MQQVPGRIGRCFCVPVFTGGWSVCTAAVLTILRYLKDLRWVDDPAVQGEHILALFERCCLPGFLSLSGAHIRLRSIGIGTTSTAG